MTCPTCKRSMTALFLTTACDYCDYGVAPDKLHRGFIVFGSGSVTVEEYVFQTVADAEAWRVASGRDGCTVRAVYSLVPFRWHLSRGCLQNVTLADHMFEIFPNHRYEPLPHRAFLMEGDNV